MSLNYDALYKQLAESPEVRKAVRKRAEKLRDYMETRWPKVNDMSANQRARLQKDPDRAILISEFDSDVDGRPMAVVTVRHPRAVSEQAKTGFATKAVNDVK